MSTAESSNTVMATVFSERRSDLTITARETRADGVVALTLADPSGAQLPGWTPGAHIDVLLADDLVRQYSLCGPPGDQHRWRIGVLLDQLREGGTLRVGVPRNHFPLHPAQQYVFIAGGIGITPILPMISTAETAGAEWHLWYGGRSLESMAFRDELAAYGDRVTLWPDDERGLLPLGEILDEPRDGALVYCCGPEPLLAAVEQKCAAWPSGVLNLERFAAKAQDPASAGAASGFEVVCQRSGVTVTVPPEKSIIEALEDVGLLRAMQAGRKTKLVPREKVMEILKGKK